MICFFSGVQWSQVSDESCSGPQINSFVKAHTNGRIFTVLTQSQMASVEVGLLINVVFFKVSLKP